MRRRTQACVGLKTYTSGKRELIRGGIRILCMANRARRLRLTAAWLGEALREVAILALVFLPFDLRVDPLHFTTLNISLFLSFILIIFGFGVTIGFVGELD